MKRNAVEAVLGAVVLLVALGFLVLGWQASHNRVQAGVKHYSAYFNNIDGLTTGSPVRIGGVEVGNVQAIGLDHTRFQAKIDLVLSDDLSLGEDSRLNILSEGLMGGKFIQLIPGISSVKLAENGVFTQTSDSVSLEDLLGRAIFLVADKDKQ